LMHCHAGCSYEEISNALNSKGINIRSQNSSDDSDGVVSRKKIKKLVRRVRLASTINKANDIYFGSRVAMKHSYFELKGIWPHDVRIRYNQLLIPMKDSKGKIRGIQFIGDRYDASCHDEDLNSKVPKKFLKGTKTNGLSYCIGTKTDTIYICEGFADAVSIYECTGEMSVAAFSCHNLVNVSQIYRKKYPHAQIVIAGDVDAVGIKCAKKAAAAIDGLFTLPCDDYEDGGIKDFNDLYRIEGKKAVRKKLAKAKHVSETGETGIVAVHISDFMKMKFPAREMILEPWLQTQSLSMIHSYRGVGKTLLSLGIAYAVTTGKSILRWTAPKRRGVLLVDGEMPGIELQERLSKMMSSSRNLNTLPLTIITQDLQDHPLPDLATEEGQLAIEQFITDDTDLIILDNLSTLLRSGIENEAESWQSLQGWLLKLRSIGKSVLIIHHSGKKGLQRGTSKREDTLDTVLGLKWPDDYSGEQGARFNICFEKGRTLYGRNAAPFEALLYENNYGKYRWIDKDIAPKKDDTKILELEKAGKTQKEIAMELKIHQGTVSRHLKEAHKNKTAHSG
ncbi:AAA family ATPase, partial [candidate division KSB1 bacterium]|nr:AAA family ATPase [candidate division KSB1 bacterium]